MKHAIPVVLALTLLAACATTPEPSATSAKAQDCNLKARTASSLHPSAPPSAYAAVVALSTDDTRDQFERSEFRRCMEGR